MPDSPLGIDKRQIKKSRSYMTIEGKKDRDKIFTLRPLLNRCFYSRNRNRNARWVEWRMKNSRGLFYFPREGTGKEQDK
jgi:hypothetical protein